MRNNKLETRYEQFFGKGTFSKLLESQKLYGKNQFIRVNKSRTSSKEIEEFLKKNRVKFSKTFLPNAFKIEKSFFNLSSSVEALSGKIYLQDLASQIPVSCIDWKKLEKKKFIKVLDMAASPGSKTTQIADELLSRNLKYKIVALEPEKKRILRLINNIQKQGFENIEIINSRGESFSTKEKFDIILLDAPCSGNLVDDRSWLKKREVSGIMKNSQLQKQLLNKAQELLENSGQLIYSTCSLEVEENEENVDWALKKLKLKSKSTQINFPFSVKPLQLKKSDKGVLKSLRFMPFESKTQGFFVCCFEK